MTDWSSRVGHNHSLDFFFIWLYKDQEGGDDQQGIFLLSFITYADSLS